MASLLRLLPLSLPLAVLPIASSERPLSPSSVRSSWCKSADFPRPFGVKNIRNNSKQRKGRIASSSALDVRGGGMQNQDEINGWKDCYRYATIGIVNLLSDDILQPEHGDVSDAPATYSNVEELISHSILSSNRASPGHVCRLLCIPSDINEDSEALLGQFQSTHDTSDTSKNEQAALLSASCETIGTLSDTTIVLMDSPDDMKSNNTAILLINGVERLLNGIERRIGGGDTNDGDSRPRVVIYVRRRDSGKRSSSTGAGEIDVLRNQVEDAFLLALSRRQRTSANYKEERKDGRITSVEELQRFVDIVVLPYEHAAEDSIVGADDIASPDFDVKKDLPLGMFRTFALQVYGSLLGAAPSSSPSPSSDIHDDDLIEFLSVGITATADDIDGVDEETGNENAIASSQQQQFTPEVRSTPHDDEELTPSSASTSEIQEEPESIQAELDVAAHRILSDCEGKMSDLEAKQDEVLLDPGSMPILEFGQDAQSIIQGALDAFLDAADLVSVEGDMDSELQLQVEESKMTLLRDIAGDLGLRNLFELQLQSLREYYGRQYESILDEVLLNDGEDDGEGEDSAKDKEKREAILTDAAQRATEGFRTAAKNAIPALCEQGQLLEHLDYDIILIRDLNGLMQDMVEATISRQSLEDEWDAAATGSSVGNNEEDGERDTEGKGGNVVRGRHKGPAKWYEKVAARALVLGVNYLQGWLALQQLRKAAADRDKAMPKFPLF